MAEVKVNEGQVQPDAARQYVTNFVHDPAVLGTLPDDKVIEYHGRVRGQVDSAVQAALKERGDWTPEWRQKFAGEDTEAMKTLERMASPADVWKSFKELRTKFSAGEAKFVTPYPEKGTPEQQTQWRTEQGIPPEPKGYTEHLPEGVVIGDDDKPFIDGFLANAHKDNMPQAAVNSAINWWHQDRIARQEQAAVQLETRKKEVEDTLRNEWGVEFRPNQNRIEGVIDAHLPSGDKNGLKGKIMTAVATDPEFARLMAGIAFKLNPTPTLVTGGAEGQAQSVTDWLSKADALMRTDPKKYQKTMANEYTKYATAYQTFTGKQWGR